MTFASLWFIGGLFTDGWAHNHIPELESFFTPWHAIFYSGYFAVTLTLLFLTWRNHRTGISWKEAIPRGYKWPLIGAAIFFAGGLGDMTWHQIFGIEADIEALHSPTHLILATGMTLMLSGGLLSWMTRKNASLRIIDTLPMILSVACIYSIITFMTQYAHLVDLRPAGVEIPRDNFFPQALSMAGFIIHFVAFTGLLCLIMKSGKKPKGLLTIVLTLNIFAMGTMRENAVLCIAAGITGIIGDLLLDRLYPYEKHLPAIRMMLFCIPALFLSLYFGYIITTQGTWWSVHMWTGSAFIAGISGLLISFVAWPPVED